MHDDPNTVRIAATAAGRLGRQRPGTDYHRAVGLGAMLVAAGLHKLVVPTAGTVYVTDWLVPWLVVSPTTFMLANGVLELAFGALLLADRYTVFAAFVAAVSLAATTAYLAIASSETGAFGDIIARDIGLTGLAFAVLVDALE